jgi:Anti-sigma-K factor rskA
VGRELTPPELHELLAAYALDAVDGDERLQIEDWLERAPDAQAELAELRETAALLARRGGDAPPGLWARIEGELGEEPTGLVLPLDEARRTRGRRPSVLARGAAIVAAASAIAASATYVILDHQMARQEDRLEQVARSVTAESTHRAADAASADPSATTVELASIDGDRHATVVTLPDGSGYLMRHNLPPLPEGHTYQLWAITGSPGNERLVSAGVLGPSFGVAAFRGPNQPLGYAVTDEEAPGAVRSHQHSVVAS